MSNMSGAKEQIDEMLLFIEEHPEMAQNYNKSISQERQNLNILWDELKTRLNSMGYRKRSSAGWRKIWANYKYRAKKKLSLKQIGGDSSEEVSLNATQEKVVELVNLQTAVGGYEEVLLIETPLKDFDNDEFPSTQQSSSAEDTMSEDNISITTKKRKYSSQNDDTKRSKAHSDICDLLREQVDNERKYQKKVLQLMRERNEEEKSFHTNMLKLIKEKNDFLFRQISKIS